MPLTDGKITRSKYIGRQRIVTEVEAKQVYERLRKASYRQNGGNRMALYGLSLSHMMYVQGVRDALKELMR